MAMRKVTITCDDRARAEIEMRAREAGVDIRTAYTEALSQWRPKAERSLDVPGKLPVKRVRR